VRATAVLVAFAAALMVPNGTRAQNASRPLSGAATPPRDVRVRESSCNEVPWTSAGWMDLLRAELAGDGVTVRAASEATVTDAPTVSVDPVRCGGNATSATLTFSAGKVWSTREIRLDDADPIARPRALAIAMADMVRSALSNVAADGESRSLGALDVRIHIEAPRPALPTARRLDEPPSARTAIFAAVETRTFPEGSTALLGGRAGLLVPLLDSVALAADAGLLGGSAHDPLGDIDATVVTAGAAILGTGRAGSVMLGVGPRVEVGVAWLDGHAAATTTAEATERTGLLLVAASAAASFQIRRSWSGLMALDVGTSVYGFSGRADGRHALELMGPMLAVRVGFAWSPGAP